MLRLTPACAREICKEAIDELLLVDLASLGAGSSASLHLIGEAMKLAFVDRALYMGDARSKPSRMLSVSISTAPPEDGGGKE